MSQFPETSSEVDDRSIVSLESVEVSRGGSHLCGVGAEHSSDFLVSPGTPNDLHVFMDSFRSETLYPIFPRHRDMRVGEPGSGDSFVLQACSPVPLSSDSPSTTTPTTLAGAMFLHNQELLRQRSAGKDAPPPLLPVPFQLPHGVLPFQSSMRDDSLLRHGCGTFEDLHEALTSLANLQPEPPSLRYYNRIAHLDASSEQEPEKCQGHHKDRRTASALLPSRRASAPNLGMKRHGSSSAASDVSSITWEDSSVCTDSSLDPPLGRTFPNVCRTPQRGRGIVRQETKLECDLDSALLYSFSDSPPKSPQRRGSMRSSASISPPADLTVDTKRQCRYSNDSSWLLSEPPPLWIVSPLRRHGLRRSVQQ